MAKFEIPHEIRERLIARRGRLHAYDAVDGASTALLVVDMQNYFLKDGERMCAPAARDIVPNVKRLASAVREAGGLVVWIMMEATEESRESWRNLHELFDPEVAKRRLASLGRHGEGFKLWHELEPDPSDRTVIKRRYSAFIQGSSDIEEVLRGRRIETVLVAGVATNVCCDSTARDCMMRGFRTIMVSDANASFTEAEHLAALHTFITYFGDVQTTDEVIVRMGAQADAAAIVG
jgi:ureidoacrylate peracid hydrolase